SGMVFTVKGAARLFTYRMSDALGSLVPVLAHSSRCARAPALYILCHRADANTLRYAAYVRLAIAIPSWLCVDSGVSAATAASQRLTKTDATDATSGFIPAAIRLSTPRIHASAAATYCSRENSSVTLMGTPAKIASSTAGSPSLVPGILIN